MANIRELKKDINYLASEIVTQGYLKLTLMNTVKEEDITPILTEAIRMRNEFIARTNHPDGKNNRKLVKKYYNKLRTDLMSKSLELLDQIQAVQ
ncbi:hypothetical protein [Saccharicrinis fermentans]|uniref:Uncharacterized protein n=1 Tax=Saccharicrinis fermentans DSM 9555 = JCM 21142 TaxID=869213 RepID=W7XTW2_9BACT|nr:hypothetical protein [Saccharicrinis fermentans]GAF01440.1 hypothetical protein JCM21142_47 [Saccharicrinis fermentans DSM 9555 = JCM 21142]